MLLIIFVIILGVVQNRTNVFDPLDLIMTTTSLFFPPGVKNDGLVGSCSSHLGMVIRDDFRMNHLDEVNMLLGLHDIWSTDPLTIFRSHANCLKTQVYSPTYSYL